MPRLVIRLFGPPQFFLDETPLKVERRKTLALLAYLGSGPVEGRARETLSALLWPDASQEQAAAYLRQSVWDFGKAAGEGWIERAGQVVCLRQDANIRVDTRVFETRLAEWKAGEHLRQGEQDNPAFIPLLEEAVGLYHADFLEGFTLRDSPAFDDWQALQAEGLRLRLGEALEALARLHGAQGAYEKAFDFALHWLALDELNEAAHRALMRLYAESGQRSAALRQYETCQRRLQDELGVAPEAATTRLFQEISSQRAAVNGEAAGPAFAPKPAVRPPLPVFLPAQATPFLGRETELSQIRQMLADPECRLITLMGLGGSGKTRLAIQAAGQSIGYPHQMNFPHGIYFAGLAGATSSAEAILTIAAALKLELRSDMRQGLSPTAARDQLLEFLAEKKVLLVLDNLETLGENEFLSGLLAAAPGIKLIATSRVRINLPEEWVLEVSGLPFPASAASAGAQNFPAVQLFLKGAGRTAGFTPQVEDWPAITRICQLVEGMPLGVELAAAWVKMLSCQEIADEIARDLDFLEANRSGAPERHRSLRAVFEYSWRLLNDNERAVFCRLSIFRGGFTREAAYQAAGASLALLSAFVDKSLLRRVSSGRFDLHELVKQYAAEKLAAEPSDQADTGARHAQYYAGWLRQKGDQLRGREMMAALTALRGEIHNLRLAWRWLVENRRYEQIETILDDFILYHEMMGENHDGGEMMSLLINAVRGDPLGNLSGSETVRGLLGLALAALRHFERGIQAAQVCAAIQQESLALAQTLPPSHTRGFILILNGTGPGSLPPEEVIRLCKESEALFEAAGDPWGKGLAYLIEGDAVMFPQNHPQQARAPYEAALAIFDRLGNDWGVALCCFGLAAVDGMSGQLEEAARLIQRSLDIYAQMGNMGRVLDARDFAGHLAQVNGRKDEARQYFTANLNYLTEVGDHRRAQYYAAEIAKL